MSKAEIGKVDPQQRMLLEVVWECMESAGQKGWRGTDVGVFVGCWGEVKFSISQVIDLKLTGRSGLD